MTMLFGKLIVASMLGLAKAQELVASDGLRGSSGGAEDDGVEVVGDEGIAAKALHQDFAPYSLTWGERFLPTGKYVIRRCQDYTTEEDSSGVKSARGIHCLAIRVECPDYSDYPALQYMWGDDPTYPSWSFDGGAGTITSVDCGDTLSVSTLPWARWWPKLGSNSSQYSRINTGWVISTQRLIPYGPSLTVLYNEHAQLAVTYDQTKSSLYQLQDLMPVAAPIDQEWLPGVGDNQLWQVLSCDNSEITCKH
ncbi:hypothetical protein ACHAWF_005021 [Thalassiosira exigua]